jgi:hypothetical protein
MPLRSRVLIFLLTTLKVALSFTVVLFVFNILVYGGYAVYETKLRKFSNSVSEYYQLDMTKYYPGMTPEQVDQLIYEGNQLVQYEPFVEFRERPRTGRYVNVFEPGFRRSIGQATWPPRHDAPIVFVFGGSTTFGYGVSDDDTVVSLLRVALQKNPKYANAQIYNFGQGFYWSTQEAVLFMRLLSSHHNPDIAIFIDGLNEFYYQENTPIFATEMKQLFALATGKQRSRVLDLAAVVGEYLYDRLPMVRLARDLRAYLGGSGPYESRPRLLPHNPAATKNSIRTYLFNKDIITGMGRSFDVRTLFVWQPIPTYEYPVELNAAFEAAHGYGPHSQSYYGYPEMRRMLGVEGNRGNLVWCADIFRSKTEPVYVDLVHYNRRGAELLASCIAEAVLAMPERPVGASPAANRSP